VNVFKCACFDDNSDNKDAVGGVGNVSQGVWSGVNLSLCAVNLGNVAGHTLATDKLAEIYALMAMTVRLYLPTAFHFLVVSSVCVLNVEILSAFCLAVCDFEHIVCC